MTNSTAATPVDAARNMVDPRVMSPRTSDSVGMLSIVPGDRRRATVVTTAEAARRARRQAEIDARATLSPSGPAPDRLRIATWNLNSLKARLAGVEGFLARVRPDVLCVQETKAPRLSPDATAMFERAGLHVAHVGANAYNGVAIATVGAQTDVVVAGDFGDEHLDREPRLVTCRIDDPEPLRIVSAYVPHGRGLDHWHYEFKLGFLASLTARIGSWLAAGERVVLATDVNVAATDRDVFHPDAFAGGVFVSAPERAALARLLAAGLVDVDVARWGADARRFTWWNHGRGYPSNLGMRLDMIAVDAVLADRLDTTWIDHIGRSAERPSDHAALIADFRRQIGGRSTGPRATS